MCEEQATGYQCSKYSPEFFSLLWSHINNSSNENQLEPWKSSEKWTLVIVPFCNKNSIQVLVPVGLGERALAMSLALRFRAPLVLSLGLNNKGKMTPLSSTSHSIMGRGKGLDESVKINCSDGKAILRINVLEPVGQHQPLCTWRISQSVFIDTEGGFNYPEGISGMFCQSQS